MKKYRIKNYNTIGYIVQERFMLIDWVTFCSSTIFSTPKIFATIEDAKDYVKEIIECKKEVKKAKHIEYL